MSVSQSVHNLYSAVSTQPNPTHWNLKNLDPTNPWVNPGTTLCRLYRCHRWMLLTNTDGANLDAPPSKYKPPPQNCIWPCYDLDLWPLMLITFGNRHSPLTCWMSVPRLTEIRPQSTQISCHAKWVLTENGRTHGWLNGQPGNIASRPYYWRRRLLGRRRENKQISSSRKASLPFGWYSLHLPTKGRPGWVDLGGWLHTEINVDHSQSGRVVKLFSKLGDLSPPQTSI